MLKDSVTLGSTRHAGSQVQVGELGPTELRQTWCHSQATQPHLEDGSVYRARWWAYLNGVELDFIRPGKSTDNAMIEAFNARLRAECLNESWFLSLEDAREQMEGGAGATTANVPTAP